MMKFNPRIHNYKNLHPDDKIFVDGMLEASEVLHDLAIETYMALHQDYPNQLSGLDKLKYEVIDSTIYDLIKRIDTKIASVITSCINDYEDGIEVKEYDTDHHLYGLHGESSCDEQKEEYYRYLEWAENLTKEKENNG